MLPGLQLRQVRERLGLTYRDVERCSYEIAAKRGRPEFILHISRLADIENRNVVPSLHKLYALAVVYHLNPVEIFRWYDIPADEFFSDGAMFPAPQTHLGAAPASLRVPLRFDPAFDPKRTAYLSRMVEQWGNFEGTLFNSGLQHRYGYIGLNDRKMVPILRPGSIVLVDTSVRRIGDIDWSSEYDRPMYRRSARGLPLRMVPSGRAPTGNAAAPAVALHARMVAHTGRSRNRRPGGRRRYAAERTVELSGWSTASSARRLEQKRSFRYSGLCSGRSTR